MSRTGADASVTAVVADTVNCGVVDDGSVVHVVDVCNIHVAHGTVVVELSVLPASTLIPITVVAIAVTDATVETNLLAPVAVVENIPVAAPAPIGRSPEQSGFRSHDPCSRHPVVAVVIAGVSPIAWCPDVALAREQRLLIHGQFWRSE